ncbi:MAG: hypothetical protein JRN43_06795 [Nitrososphaerota archaeon]|nr:hypothetical protein [Nitrososphaerota archaeon]
MSLEKYCPGCKGLVEAERVPVSAGLDVLKCREWREAMDDLRPYLEELKRRRGQPTEGP